MTQVPDGRKPGLPDTSDAGMDMVCDLLTAQVSSGQGSFGYVASIIDAGGARVVAAGRSGAENGRALDGDTVFEIGSLTKLFTALLLADMAQRGEVALSDPVAKHLPPEGQPQTFDGTPISLLDLATHTSGLPRLPGNLDPKDPANPYADYTTAQLYQAASTTMPLHGPGGHFEYSNFGFGLLGHALARRANRSYEDLVASRICRPLGLDSTRITLTPEMRGRLAPGHDGAFQVTSNWDFEELAAGGALRSTANDMIRFLNGCAGWVPTPLAAAAASLLDTRRATDAARRQVAQGCFVQREPGGEIVWMNGGTGGYSSFMGYSAETRHAAVLLANTNSAGTTSAIGMHLVSAAPLPALHRQAAIDPTDLAAYAGRYAITPGFVLTVTPQESQLMVQATGQQSLAAFPESKTRFRYRMVDAQLTFELGADGIASAVVLHQNGRNMRASRIA